MNAYVIAEMCRTFIKIVITRPHVKLNSVFRKNENKLTIR